MERIKSDQENALKEILGKKLKKKRVKITDGDVIVLGLNNTKLTTLPESISNLKLLQELNLRDNQLTTLPEKNNTRVRNKIYSITNSRNFGSVRCRRRTTNYRHCK